MDEATPIEVEVGTEDGEGADAWRHTTRRWRLVGLRLAPGQVKISAYHPWYTLSRS